MKYFTGDEDLPLISIVIPIYKVEKFLVKCLDSIISQTYENIEVILVNDGSPDNSLEICNEYASQDNRINVYSKINGGLSDARNFGIEKATGEYITFIDSDDFVTDDYVEYLYYLISRYNCKMSICSLFVHYTKSNKLVDMGTGSELVLSAENAIKKMCYHDEVDTCAYAKLYHKSLFQSIEFPKGKIFEDIGTTYKFFDASGEIACGFKAKYYYEIRDNSIVTSGFSKTKLDLLEMTDAMKAFIDENYPDLKTATTRRAVYARFSTLNQMLDVSGFEEERNKIIDYVMKHKKQVLEDSRTPRRDKVAYFALSLGFPIYKLLWKGYLKFQRG